MQTTVKACANSCALQFAAALNTPVVLQPARKFAACRAGWTGWYHQLCAGAASVLFRRGYSHRRSNAYLGHLRSNSSRGLLCIFTLSHPGKLREFVGSDHGESMLERLTASVGTIYAMNGGVFAMAQVARGVLGGFVNNITNLAAGEVLVRACSGEVTDFDGHLTDYTQLT
jgi:hypothetical protein